MRQVAVYGAAFDPPHRGHMDVVEQVLERFDAVLLVPSAAHAFGKIMAPFARRMRMTELAVAELLPDKAGRSVIISDVERCIWQEQGSVGGVYTYHVLRRLRAKATVRQEDADFTFVIGPDNAKEETWSRFWNAREIESEFGVFVAAERLSIHSTDARQRIMRCYKDPAVSFATLYGWLGEKVACYIEAHRLYAP
jgi:nicotinate-nucleotide adenylyltransferase